MAPSWTPETLRAFEEEVKEAFLAGAIRGPIHLSSGNEAPLIEIFKEVRSGDFCFSTHRSHYHALLKGVPPDLVKAEILKGWSIHLNFRDYHFMSSAIVGGCLPIAVGVALAMQRRGEDGKAWVFVGDMAATTGIFHEGVTYARNCFLPLCVVVECNGLSTNTPTDAVWGTTHDHDPAAGVRTLKDWGEGKVLKYCYDRGDTPHVGAGQWVTFS